MKRRIVTYERVSTDTQRENETIRTQFAELERRLKDEPDIEWVDRYIDDGVSGAVRLSARPEAARLLADARAHRFDELWVYSIDRLGRDGVEPQYLIRDLTELGIGLVSLKEGITSILMLSIYSGMAAEERRKFRERSVDGINRVAELGRYCGGIVPLGYLVHGVKKEARFVLDDSIPFWQEFTAFDLVRQIYERLAVDRWSTFQIADELNGLGVPTHYERDGRLVGGKGKRKEATRAIWRPGHVRQVVKNPMYRGEYQFRRRARVPGTPIISARVPRIVSDELWQAAQEAMAAHRPVSKRDGVTFYLLRSIMHSAACGLTYCGIPGQPRYGHWYRCSGSSKYKDLGIRKCQCKGIKAAEIESIVWQDVEAFLRNRTDLLDALAEADQPPDPSIRLRDDLARVEGSLTTTRRKLKNLNAALISENLTPSEHRDMRAEADKEIARLEARARDLHVQIESAVAEPVVDLNLREHLLARLEAGLCDEDRRDIVQLLVRGITITTEETEDGRRRARVVIEYRFDAICVVPEQTRRGSSS